MKINRSYKVELDLNNRQKTTLVRYCGASRFVYNWGLNRKMLSFAERQPLPTAYTLAKEFRIFRAEIAPWISNYSSYVIDATLEKCDKAFANFFRRCKSGKKGKKGFPKFKSKKRGLGTIQFKKDYKVELSRIYLPKIGWVKMKEAGYVPLVGSKRVKFLSLIVSEKAGRWFVSVQVECEMPDKEIKSDAPCIGVDFGIKTLATCSDGREILSPKPLGKSLRKLRRTSRAMSRKIEAAKRENRSLRDSKNFQKNKRQLAKLHARIANIRANTLHNLSHSLTKNKSGVCIEDLNVAGMMKNRKLARHVADVSFSELRRQIEYKSKWYGTRLVIADRWFPSSKTCGQCGAINCDLKLQDRTWECACGAKHNRDLNAAKNLAEYARKLAVTATDNQNACGEGVLWPETSVSGETHLCEAGTGQLLLF